MANKSYFRFRLIAYLRNWLWFARDYFKYRNINKNPIYKASFQPCLEDNTTFTPMDPIYFYQDTWLARKIAENKPVHHYDIGSKATSIAIISQFVPVTMVDIRPLPFTLDNLHFQTGSILELPFEDNSIISLSSICVIEHIGLGRYGDPLDAFGSEKSFSEMKRVLAKDGNFYFTVPIDTECKYYFNANRSFTKEYLMELMSGLELIEEVYLYGSSLQSNYEKEKGFGTGFFWFKK